MAAKAQAQGRCRNSDPAVVFECVYDTVEAAEETARTEEDLTAQQRAAWAAVVAAMISFVSLPIGALGLWALLRSLAQSDAALREARKANEIFIKIEQPKLFLTPANYTAFHPHKNGVMCRVTNLGKMPCQLRRIRYQQFSGSQIPDNLICFSEINKTIGGVETGQNNEVIEIIFGVSTYPQDNHIYGFMEYDTAIMRGHKSYFCFAFALRSGSTIEFFDSAHLELPEDT